MHSILGGGRLRDFYIYVFSEPSLRAADSPVPACLDFLFTARTKFFARVKDPVSTCHRLPKRMTIGQ